MVLRGLLSVALILASFGAGLLQAEENDQDPMSAPVAAPQMPAAPVDAMNEGGGMSGAEAVNVPPPPPIESSGTYGYEGMANENAPLAPPVPNYGNIQNGIYNENSAQMEPAPPPFMDPAAANEMNGPLPPQPAPEAAE